MTFYKRLDLDQDVSFLHGPSLSRVTTRRSITDVCDYTILRDLTQGSIPCDMIRAPVINMEKLRADMAEHVERTSARKFSLAVTDQRNPDFYRNFVNDGQDKRMSAEIFFGIVHAMGRSPADYVSGMETETPLPNAAVLTSTFAVLLDSLGIDPYEDARAQKLAAQFPSVLKHTEALRALALAGEPPPSETVPTDDVEGRKST